MLRSADARLILAVIIFTVLALLLQIPIFGYQQKMASKQAAEQAAFEKEFGGGFDESESEDFSDAEEAERAANNRGYSDEEDAPQSTPVGGNAGDSKIQSDLNVLAMQLEVYYIDHGSYPLTGEFNDQAWRTKNMRGLESDISGKVGSVYAYTTVPDNCINEDDSYCDEFNLKAKLSTGKELIKKSLNNY